MMRIWDFAWIAVVGLMIGSTSGAVAKSAIHTQLDELSKLANGKRLGVLTNASARTADGLHDMDYLMQNTKTTVTAFFGPEHGFRAELADGEKSGDGTDPKTGVPVYSLYGKRQAPTPEQLKNIDLFVFDIPDVGCGLHIRLDYDACHGGVREGWDSLCCD